MACMLLCEVSEPNFTGGDMRYGIQLRGKRVAPRYAAAQTIRLVNMRRGYVSAQAEVPAVGQSWVDLFNLLAEHKVDILVCGGIDMASRESLSAGGITVIDNVACSADQVLGATPEIDARYEAAWLRQVRERGVGEDDLASALERMKEDDKSTLGSQMECLKEIGFEMVDCWYKNFGLVVYAGRKRISNREDR